MPTLAQLKIVNPAVAAILEALMNQFNVGLEMAAFAYTMEQNESCGHDKARIVAMNTKSVTLECPRDLGRGQHIVDTIVREYPNA